MTRPGLTHGLQHDNHYQWRKPDSMTSLQGTDLLIMDLSGCSEGIYTEISLATAHS